MSSDVNSENTEEFYDNSPYESRVIKEFIFEDFKERESITIKIQDVCILTLNKMQNS